MILKGFNESSSDDAFKRNYSGPTMLEVSKMNSKERVDLTQIEIANKDLTKTEATLPILFGNT